MQKPNVSPLYIRGAILILLGILVMFYSEDSIKALGLLPGLIITIVGLAQVGFALMAKKNLAHWAWYLAGGIAVTIIGVVLMLNPTVTLTMLILAIGAWFIFQGVQDFMASQTWKKYGHPNWKFLVLSGILNFIVGLLFVFNPLKGAMTVTVMIGLGMIFCGVFAIVAANFLRKHVTIETTENTTKININTED